MYQCEREMHQLMDQLEREFAAEDAAAEAKLRDKLYEERIIAAGERWFASVPDTEAPMEAWDSFMFNADPTAHQLSEEVGHDVGHVAVPTEIVPVPYLRAV